MIPGGDSKTRYVFQVVEWNAAARRWVVSHAAHGDEQLCHLFVEDDPHDETRLRLFFSDAETKCEGAMDASGVIAGKVAQLVRPEEEFEHASSADDVFRLEPAVGTCFTPMVEARVARLARWKIAPKVMPGVFEALDAAQRAAGGGGARDTEADALADRLRSTRLVSAPPLARETLEALATVPLVGKHDARRIKSNAASFDATPFSRDSFSFQREDDFAAGGDASCAYDDDDVETLDAGAECDERAELLTTQLGSDTAPKPYKSTVGRTGFLEATRMTPAERDWWRLWRTAQFAAEAECCATRERARRLKTETFATRSVKRARVKQEMSQSGVLGGRRAAHARAHVLLNRQHQLLWRALNASDMPPEILNQVVSQQAKGLKQSEFRLHVAYQLFDEALRAFERRLPTESIERRSAVVPPGGVGAMKGAIPGFDAKKASEDAKETTCPICADVVKPGQTLCALDCRHLFHPACIQDWVHNNPSCPMCREEVLERVRGDPEDEPESEEEEEREAEPEASDGVGDGAGVSFPGAPPGFVPVDIFESMMRAMAGRGGAVSTRFPVGADWSPETSHGSGDEDGREEGDESGESGEDDEERTLGDGLGPRRLFNRTRGDDADGPSAADGMDEDWPEMPHDDEMPDLVESSDDEDGDRSVPDLVDSSDDDDAALATTIDVD